MYYTWNYLRKLWKGGFPHPNCFELCRLYSPLVLSIFTTLTHHSDKTQPIRQTWSLGPYFWGGGRKSLPFLELERSKKIHWLCPFLDWESPINVTMLNYRAGHRDKCLNISRIYPIPGAYGLNTVSRTMVSLVDFFPPKINYLFDLVN